MASLLSYRAHSYLSKDGATHGGPRPDFPQGRIATWKCKPNISSLLGVGFGHGLYHGNRNQVGAVLGSILERGLQERAYSPLPRWFPLSQVPLMALVYPAAQCGPGLKKGVLEMVVGPLCRRVSYAFAPFLGCRSIAVVSGTRKQAPATGSHRNLFCQHRPRQTDLASSLCQIPGVICNKVSGLEPMVVFRAFSFMDRQMFEEVWMWPINYNLFSHMRGIEFKSRLLTDKVIYVFQSEAIY